ncbi:Fusaridione A cluster transcription factor fsdR [Fusarium oxysporum f. sp. albedinis]|nr:Fusaridione A cluster transcription factor fsdR [Fusarium oxysporum f. sp. albedinis]
MSRELLSSKRISAPGTEKLLGREDIHIRSFRLGLRSLRRQRRGDPWVRSPVPRKQSYCCPRVLMMSSARSVHEVPWAISCNPVRSSILSSCMRWFEREPGIPASGNYRASKATIPGVRHDNRLVCVSESLTTHYSGNTFFLCESLP